jgi:two-component system sensor histidine kinase RegB
MHRKASAPPPVPGSHDSAATPWYLTATTLAAVPWFARLRWTRAAIDLTVVTVAWLFPHLDFPLRELVPLLLCSAALSVLAALRLSRRQPVPPVLAASDLLLQPVLLTGLLELTGGPFNPFAVVYVVPIALAALTLGRTAGVGVALFGVAGYSLLAYWHLTEIDEGHHRLNDFPTHLFTMWVSVALAAELATYFIVQASNALARRQQQLETVRQQAARAERLVSLTTLAAGAAHELSTPLATIALAARELERSATSRGTVPDLAEDARLIRAEVDRCRSILDQMSGRAGGSAVDDPEEFPLAALFDDVRSRVPRDRADRLVLELPDVPRTVRLPRSGLTQAVLSLVMNALDADLPRASTPVVIRVGSAGGMLSIAVMDSGTGMTPEALRRAGEPFYTTKDPGKGLGLGLFLARAFAERRGGSLTVTSRDAATTATLEVPLHAEPSQVQP